MIPSDFSDYFNGCSDKEQQVIVKELLSMTLSNGQAKNNSQEKILSCPFTV